MSMMKPFRAAQVKAVLLGLAITFAPIVTTSYAEAAKPTADELEAQIAEQQRILNELTEQRSQKKSDELKNKLAALEDEITRLKKKDNYDSRGAIESISLQIANLQDELSMQAKSQEKLMQAIEKLDHLTGQRSEKADAVSASKERLVNPGPRGTVSYTQDAKNAQNNSTMVFAYAPDQLYKIYCRTGYLTDIELRKGETVSFVGGGDTSAWAINSTKVAGTPHIYIKPVVPASTTNIIITTDKRSYQLLVNTSEWYNPMVRWTYGQEEAAEFKMRQAKDERTITDTMNVSDASKLCFDYKISVKGNSDLKPQMVFDDGEKTIIRLKKATSKLPALFIRERGHKGVSLANFKIKHDSYILDRVIEQAELRYDDHNIVTIERKS